MEWGQSCKVGPTLLYLTGWLPQASSRSRTLRLPPPLVRTSTTESNRVFQQRSTWSQVRLVTRWGAGQSAEYSECAGLPSWLGTRHPGWGHEYTPMGEP